MAPKDNIAPIYNATYSLFRLSPLYVSSVKGFWEEDSLNFHALRFADSIQSDNLRTVTTAIEEADDTINRIGPFKQCRWHILRQPSDDDDEEEESRSADNLGVLAGVQVDIVYERASYMGLLLRGVDEKDNKDDEVRCPLVCIRMPAALRTSFTNYLATVFDTRMEPLHFSSTAICKSLERFLDECAEDEDSFEKIVKEIQLTLSFNKPINASLRTMEIAIRRDDVLGFLKQGKALNATSNSQIKLVDGVFMIALQKYLQVQVALNINADEVLISRIACGAFALGREGKVKMFAPLSSTDTDGDYDAAAMASRRATAQVLQVIMETAKGNT